MSRPRTPLITLASSQSDVPVTSGRERRCTNQYMKMITRLRQEIVFARYAVRHKSHPIMLRPISRAKSVIRGLVAHPLTLTLFSPCMIPLKLPKNAMTPRFLYANACRSRSPLFRCLASHWAFWLATCAVAGKALLSVADQLGCRTCRQRHDLIVAYPSQPCRRWRRRPLPPPPQWPPGRQLVAALP